jgi:next-to-BRCA1 protein 1
MTLASRSNVLTHSVQPGETTVFTVTLRSPAREGRAISYWRLKTPEEVPFGHKLWVDINVKTMPVELPIRSILADAIPALQLQSTPVADNKDKSEAASSEHSSTMIFPKLEKESPVSSIHNISEVTAPTVEPTMKTEAEELLEEVESLELEEESDDEDFLTDEEYDILDASDEDFLLEAQNAVGKK